MSEDNRAQDHLMTALEKAVLSSTEEWNMTIVDVVGCIETVKHNYLRISDTAIEDEDDDM